MNSPRGLANHSLYLAHIQLAAWRFEAEREVVPATTLAQAFSPATCEHLRRAYGWFLLTLTGHADTSAAPPRCCAELPGIAPGKALSGEIREFAQLEQDGWLADLLSVDASVPAPGRPAAGRVGNIAVTATDSPSLADVMGYCEQLELHMTRMSNSLDEY